MAGVKSEIYQSMSPSECPPPPPPLPGLSLVPLCKPSDQLSVFIYRLNALTQHQVSSAARSAQTVSHCISVSGAVVKEQ